MDIKAFYHKHEKGIKLLGVIVLIAFVVTILVGGVPTFEVNE
jgi:hypothetical protein